MTALTEKQKREAEETTEAIARLEAELVRSTGTRKRTLGVQHEELLAKAKQKAS